MPADRLFGPLFSTPAMLELTSDRGWLAAMLEVEAALARAEAIAGLISETAAKQIAAACDPAAFDLDQLGRDSRAGGSPVIPLVKALTERAGAEGAGYVHWGATSQDVLDSALMLIAKRGVDLVAADLERLAAACAAQAERHRDTLMPGRTLLQQALPITFGFKVAGWLDAVMQAQEWLAAYQRHGLAAQLGGAVGTLAALGDAGPRVRAFFAAELGLPNPPLPWHSSRNRIAELGGVLALAAGAAGKIAFDVELLAQTEVGEVAEPAGPGRGASSTMPQKRNPAASVIALACARGAQAQAALLFGAQLHEHERSAGVWQTEWPAVSEALRLAAGAVDRMAEVVAGLQVEAERMRRNLDLTGGLLLAENVMMRLAPKIGRGRAHDLVEAVVKRGGDFRAELGAEPAIAAALTERDLEDALDPRGYLGSAGEFVDAVLATRAARSRAG